MDWNSWQRSNEIHQTMNPKFCPGSVSAQTKGNVIHVDLGMGVSRRLQWILVPLGVPQGKSILPNFSTSLQQRQWMQPTFFLFLDFDLSQ